MEIPYYSDYVSPNFLKHLLEKSKDVSNVPDLKEVGSGGGLESAESLRFLCDLYDSVKGDLRGILKQRVLDRKFIDQRAHACHMLNSDLGHDYLSPRYQTAIGHEDAQGRIVMGPLNPFYCKKGYDGGPVAPIPSHLAGAHVTLFGPPDSAKICVDAMHCRDQAMPNEPAVVTECVAKSSIMPKWGADDEDSKTPIRSDLVSSSALLTGCFDGSVATGATTPIKRFPGLGLPCTFLLYRGNPLPMHLYDFALHIFANWSRPEALSFYVPKLENEEEARYVGKMVAAAERVIQQLHPEYKMGSVRLFVVLENPRAAFRINEIMDELHPYFAGASLGWHDYLASTARLFKADPSYRIPVKADPNIVINCIAASHRLLADVVGSRGGIKIGGMYGVMATSAEQGSDSFRTTIKGYIKDIITQLRRNLDGFWVPDGSFVRIGIALVEAWDSYKTGDAALLEGIVRAYLSPSDSEELLAYIRSPDQFGLDCTEPLYNRALLVADLKENTLIANNHPDEVRYNCFQAVQYLADWLAGNACVALPAVIKGVAVRVMDDLATTERSRWEVWAELHHGRLDIEDLVRIAHEEMHFIRKDRSNETKIVQVKLDERTEKWYPVAFKVMLLLMTNPSPVEFATELLLVFTDEDIRASSDPWAVATAIDADKFRLTPHVERLCAYFAICGCMSFAKPLAKDLVLDLDKAENLIMDFTLENVQEAASFHGDIGEKKKTLDMVAAREQAGVAGESEDVLLQLATLGAQYLKKFGVKFLISAQGKSGSEVLEALKLRINNSVDMELMSAKRALYEISLKRLESHPATAIRNKIQDLQKKHSVVGAMICISTDMTANQTICVGEGVRGSVPVAEHTRFEIASLSKTFAAAFAIQYFKKKGISINSSANKLLARTSSPFRIGSADPAHPEWGDEVTVAHLMSHCAINMHYVNGIPLEHPMPDMADMLEGHADYGYAKVVALHEPGTTFQYSGGGFMVLQHLMELMEGRDVVALTTEFFHGLGMYNTSFDQKNAPGVSYAHAYKESGDEVSGTRQMHPAFAAGGLGTATDLTLFLQELTRSYNNPCHRGPISHDTAIDMLFGTDKGCQKFMGCRMGLGIFIAEAGANKVAIHQGANAGFRCIYAHCFAGPDVGKGFVVLVNAELNGVLFISEVAQLLLQELNMSGVQFEKFKSNFSIDSIPTEQIVNMGYKQLVFAAFEPDIAEEIAKKGARDPLADYNLSIGGDILEVTNQRFARAENLIAPYVPTWDPELFGRQGKIMDSWETVRHNLKPFDFLVFKLRKPSKISFVSLSTKFHLGNQCQAASVEGRMTDDENEEWKTIVPKVGMEGHSMKRLLSSDSATVFRFIRVCNYPDGGLSRLCLYDASLPAAEQKHYKPASEAPVETFPDKIPMTAKPLTPNYTCDTSDLEAIWARVDAGLQTEVGNYVAGGKIFKVTNEHYGPAVQILSPFPPIHMFDGLESARSRIVGHEEEVIVELHRACNIGRIVLDFHFFVNNNPLNLYIQGCESMTAAGEPEGGWVSLVPMKMTKGYAGNGIEFMLSGDQKLKYVRVMVLPCGGYNRLRIYSTGKSNP